ncbi:MAG: nuclear transport factor 2 family protein, partial [Bacteroidota bacterium]
MHPHEILITRFYQAFHQRDFKVMQDAYHSEAIFSDPAFINLSSREVRGMWQMLLTSAKDLEVTFSSVRADDNSGKARWEAHYTFTLTGRKVHNIIDAEFIFRDGKIFRHEDRFNFWRWSRMALGLKGVLLGWSPLVINKVRRTARGRLDKFLAS